MSDGGPFDGDGATNDPFADISAVIGQFLSTAGGIGISGWDGARQMAAGLATQGRAESNVDPMARMQLEQLQRVAELHVTDLTGLTARGGVSATALTRAQWATRTVDDYRPLFERLSGSLGRLVTSQLQLLDPSDLDELGDAFPAGSGFDLAAMLSGFADLVGPAMLVTLAGSTAGQLAARAFGTYDLPIPRPPGTEIAVILDGLDEFAEQWSLPTDDLRLWLCLHETAHHLVLSIPHVHQRLTELLASHAGAFEVDPDALEATLGPIDVDDPASIERVGELMSSPERLLGTLRSETQRELLPRIDALVGCIEGYVDWVLDTIGARLLTNASMVGEALRRRRVEADAATRFVERLFGLELTQEKIDSASAFISAIVDRHGPDGLGSLWSDLANIPTPAELATPGLWMARVGLADNEPLPELSGQTEIPDFPDFEA